MAKEIKESLGSKIGNAIDEALGKTAVDIMKLQSTRAKLMLDISEKKAELEQIEIALNRLEADKIRAVTDALREQNVVLQSTPAAKKGKASGTRIRRSADELAAMKAKIVAAIPNGKDFAQRVSEIAEYAGMEPDQSVAKWIKEAAKKTGAGPQTRYYMPGEPKE